MHGYENISELAFKSHTQKAVYGNIFIWVDSKFQKNMIGDP